MAAGAERQPPRRDRRAPVRRDGIAVEQAIEELLQRGSLILGPCVLQCQSKFGKPALERPPIRHVELAEDAVPVVHRAAGLPQGTALVRTSADEARDELEAARYGVGFRQRFYWRRSSFSSASCTSGARRTSAAAFPQGASHPTRRAGAASDTSLRYRAARARHALRSRPPVRGGRPP